MQRSENPIFSTTVQLPQLGQHPLTQYLNIQILSDEGSEIFIKSLTACFSAFFHFIYQLLKSMGVFIMRVKPQWVQFSLCLFQPAPSLGKKTNTTMSCVWRCLLSAVCSDTFSECLGMNQRRTVMSFEVTSNCTWLVCKLHFNMCAVIKGMWCRVNMCVWLRGMKEIFQWNTLIQVDTTRLITAFGTDDTAQLFKSQVFSKSLFLMRYRGPSDSTNPKNSSPMTWDWTM